MKFEEASVNVLHGVFKARAVVIWGMPASLKGVFFTSMIITMHKFLADKEPDAL